MTVCQPLFRGHRVRPPRHVEQRPFVPAHPALARHIRPLSALICTMADAPNPVTKAIVRRLMRHRLGLHLVWSRPCANVPMTTGTRDNAAGPAPQQTISKPALRVRPDFAIRPPRPFSARRTNHLPGVAPQHHNCLRSEGIGRGFEHPRLRPRGCVRSSRHSRNPCSISRDLEDVRIVVNFPHTATTRLRRARPWPRRPPPLQQRGCDRRASHGVKRQTRLRVATFISSSPIDDAAPRTAFRLRNPSVGIASHTRPPHDHDLSTPPGGEQRLYRAGDWDAINSLVQCEVSPHRSR